MEYRKDGKVLWKGIEVLVIKIDKDQIPEHPFDGNVEYLIGSDQPIRLVANNVIIIDEEEEEEELY